MSSNRTRSSNILFLPTLILRVKHSLLQCLWTQIYDISSECYKDFTHHLSASHNGTYQPNPKKKQVWDKLQIQSNVK